MSTVGAVVLSRRHHISTSCVTLAGVNHECYLDPSLMKFAGVGCRENYVCKLVTAHCSNSCMYVIRDVLCLVLADGNSNQC